MLRLPARRARAQWPLLVALLAIVTLGASLLGVCALLVTRTADRAVEVAAARADPDEIWVTAYTVRVPGRDARSVAADTRALLTAALAPFPATTTARASSVPRRLPPDGHRAKAETYLSAVEGLPSRAQLVTGRWPRARSGQPTPLEAVLLEPTARVLGLAPGDRVRLGPELYGETGGPVEVTVVGVVRALPGSGWDRDPLAGAGYDLAFANGQTSVPVHAYGPFLVDPADLLASGSTLDRLELTAYPELTDPHRRDLEAVTASLLGADRRLARTLGTRVKLERVATPLPHTLLTAADQQRVTAATVFAVAALGSVLAGTALALAGRLTAGVRAEETELLSALGFSRARLAAAATLEAGVIALLGAALAVPASALLHAGLTRLPPLAGAGLAAGPSVGGLQLLAVAAGALALTAVLVVPVLRPAPPAGGRVDRREVLARSGADLLLAVLAAVGFWQLRSTPATAGSGTDLVRVLAPALLLVAGAALALRVVRPVLAWADGLSRRSDGLVLPLAASGAARRPQAVAAGLLVGLACAAGTFGVAYQATWQRSQQDQADLAVGTDLALRLTTAPTPGAGSAVAAATGGTVSPATDRGVVVGQWLGGPGDPPRLVAVDTTRAGALLRGRAEGGRPEGARVEGGRVEDGWDRLGAALAPKARATGITVPAGAAITIAGTATGGPPVTVVPRLLLQDRTGLRTSCAGDPVPLDGRPHRLPPCATAAGLQLVAVALPVIVEPGPLGSLPPGDVQGTGTDVQVTLSIPGGVASGAGWNVLPAPPSHGGVHALRVAVAGTGSGAALQLRLGVTLDYSEDDARELVATAFGPPGPIPVAVSARLADALGAHPGSRLTLTVGAVPVPVDVTEVITSVPSAPGAAAVLADADALSRALVSAGNLDAPVDAFWVGGPRPDAAARVAALRIGTVTTRAQQADRLGSGPLRAALPASLRLLVPAAVLLLLAGVVLHVTCDLQLRAVEVARLRGLGMARRDIRRVLLGQHAGILLPVLLAGTVVGGLAGALVAPLLIRSGDGAVPVPAAVPSWPWAAEAALLAVLLGSCLLAVATVVTVLARRADAAHLRVVS